MPDDSRLLELVMRWEALREAGQNLSAADLCQDCPELAPALQEQLKALQAMDAVLGADTTLQDPDGKGTIESSFPSIPGYEILRELGRGGMGVVYQARQAGSNRLVALKMLPADRHVIPLQRARFEAEVEALTRLQHPHVVQVFDIGEHEGRAYFAMEYLDGGNLDEKIGSRPQPPRQAAELVEVLAHTIHAAHQRGVIHRDLKPANVMLTADGMPKIGDFGLARRLDAIARLTRTLQILGTPSYMSPEQASGRSKQAGPSCDVYALGAILYQMLTGRPPFHGAYTQELVRRAAEEEPEPPRHLESAVPEDLEAICLKCLHKKAGGRYSSAATLADDLRRFLDHRPVRARPIGRWRRLLNWVRSR